MKIEIQLDNPNDCNKCPLHDSEEDDCRLLKVGLPMIMDLKSKEFGRVPRPEICKQTYGE